MANITNISQNTFNPASLTIRNIPKNNTAQVCIPNIKFKGQPEKDSLEIRSDKENTPEKVSTTRAIFKYLDQETINKVNETGRLPENMMITQGAGGRYFLAWRDPLTQGQLIGGTSKMPEHLELKKDIFGFTRVVPKDYNHFLIK